MHARARERERERESIRGTCRKVAYSMGNSIRAHCKFLIFSGTAWKRTSFRSKDVMFSLSFG